MVRKKRTLKKTSTASPVRKKRTLKKKEKTREETWARKTSIRGGTLVIEEDREGDGVHIRWYLPPRGAAQVGMLGFTVGIRGKDIDEQISDKDIVSCLITYTEVTEALARVRREDKQR